MIADVQWQFSCAVWNIGIIATNLSSPRNWPSRAIVIDSRYTAVWLPTTPLGSAVVPLV